MSKSWAIMCVCMGISTGCTGGDDMRNETGFAATATTLPPEPDFGTSGGDGGSSGVDEADVCGDGIIGRDEACDDGVDNGDYGRCNETCTGPGPRCGDGLVSGPEACDDGNLDDSDDCNSQCAATTCGDGIVQAATEACDDGRNGNQDDGCTDACALPSCGDGLVQASLGEVCDDGNAAAEDGCEPDCTATTKTVFLTSQKLRGDFGGVLLADQFCHAAANFAGLHGTYMAWLSDGTLRPATRFTPSVFPYVLIDGTVVADDFVDLIDGILDHAINMDELGLTPPEEHTYVWTGVLADGYTSKTNCDKWTEAPGDFTSPAYVGDAWQTTGDWSFRTQVGCNAQLSLYCFEQ